MQLLKVQTLQAFEERQAEGEGCLLSMLSRSATGLERRGNSFEMFAQHLITSGSVEDVVVFSINPVVLDMRFGREDICSDAIMRSECSCCRRYSFVKACVEHVTQIFRCAAPDSWIKRLRLDLPLAVSPSPTRIIFILLFFYRIHSTADGNPDSPSFTTLFEDSLIMGVRRFLYAYTSLMTTLPDNSPNIDEMRACCAALDNLGSHDSVQIDDLRPILALYWEMFHALRPYLCRGGEGYISARNCVFDPKQPGPGYLRAFIEGALGSTNSDSVQTLGRNAMFNRRTRMCAPLRQPRLTPSGSQTPTRSFSTSLLPAAKTTLAIHSRSSCGLLT